MKKQKVYKSSNEKKDSTETKRNITWENNHVAIRDAYVEIIRKKKRAATYTEIRNITGISRGTILKHIKDLEFEPMRIKANMLTEDVIHAIGREAIKGSASSQKLWMQIVAGWIEKKDVNIGGKISIIDLMKNESE